MSMIDISDKSVTKRRAVACATIRMNKKTFQILMTKGSPKGNVLESAKIAGIMSAKITPSIIPLCHPLTLDKVKVDFEVIKSKNSIRAVCEVVCCGKTGVEMEALTAASAACLTIYDMMKWAQKDMTITDVKLLHKSGGKSGTFQRKDILD